ncbi:MAG: hypothetical protein J5563_03685 [Clostridia bacterium]|nr:hypothetical protein [Clostridia bacterium]
MKKNYDRVETELITLDKPDADILSTSGDIQMCGSCTNELAEEDEV